VAAVTAPVEDTVATDALSEVHMTGLLVSSPPVASRRVAVPCAVSTAVIVAGTRVTVTDATDIGVTVSIALPVFPSLIAVIVAVPGRTAVTTPVLDTVATEALPELQSMIRPVREPPLASSVLAVA
jgi:hypothetical protein